MRRIDAERLERSFGVGASEYSLLMATPDGKPLDERLEEIGAQLAWVRDYL